MCRHGALDFHETRLFIYQATYTFRCRRCDVFVSDLFSIDTVINMPRAVKSARSKMNFNDVLGREMRMGKREDLSQGRNALRKKEGRGTVQSGARTQRQALAQIIALSQMGDTYLSSSSATATVSRRRAKVNLASGTLGRGSTIKSFIYLRNTFSIRDNGVTSERSSRDTFD